MLRAKRSIEALLANRSIFVQVPRLEDAETFANELLASGVTAAIVTPSEALDVRSLRERLNLTREQFALCYGLEVETVRNWEMGKREPDTTARSYLRVIANDPEGVQQAFAPTR